MLFRLLLLVIQLKNWLQQKINKIEKKNTDHDHCKYITSPEFKKWGKMYFISNDGSKNMFVYQLTLDILQLKKKHKDTNSFMGYIRLSLSDYMPLSYLA